MSTKPVIFFFAHIKKPHNKHTFTEKMLRPISSSGGKGDPGPPGIPGAPGSAGGPGPAGNDGNDGADGERGAPGERGLNGSTGSPGPEGPQGLPGLVGGQGLQGEQGNPGPPGLNGNSFAISYSVGIDDMDLLVDPYDPNAWEDVFFEDPLPTTGQFALTNLNNPELEDDSKLFCFNGTGWVQKGDLSGVKGATGEPGQNGTPGDPGQQGSQGPQGPAGGTQELEDELAEVRSMQDNLNLSIDAAALQTELDQKTGDLQASIDALTVQVTDLEGAPMVDGEYRLTFPDATEWQTDEVDEVYKVIVEYDELKLYLKQSDDSFTTSPTYTGTWNNGQYEDESMKVIQLITKAVGGSGQIQYAYLVLDDGNNVGVVTAPQHWETILGVSLGDYELTGLGKSTPCEVTATATSLLVYEQLPDGSYTEDPGYTYVWNSETKRFEDEYDSANYLAVTARQDGYRYDVSDSDGWTDGLLTPLVAADYTLDLTGYVTIPNDVQWKFDNSSNALYDTFSRNHARLVASDQINQEFVSNESTQFLEPIMKVSLSIGQNVMFTDTGLGNDAVDNYGDAEKADIIFDAGQGNHVEITLNDFKMENYGVSPFDYLMMVYSHDDTPYSYHPITTEIAPDISPQMGVPVYIQGFKTEEQSPTMDYSSILQILGTPSQTLTDDNKTVEEHQQEEDKPPTEPEGQPVYRPNGPTYAAYTEPYTVAYTDRNGVNGADLIHGGGTFHINNDADYRSTHGGSAFRNGMTGTTGEALSSEFPIVSTIKSRYVRFLYGSDGSVNDRGWNMTLTAVPE